MSLTNENNEMTVEGVYYPPFLKTQESLPQQIDPEVLYVGLPDGWVTMDEAVGDIDVLNAPGFFLIIKSGRELMSLLR
jgi:hypothetical protein